MRKQSLRSTLVTRHHFCIDERKNDDGSYDSIDRSDEQDVESDQTALDSDITLTLCNGTTGAWDYAIAGVMCGSFCQPAEKWCREDYSVICDTGSGRIVLNETRACNNPLLWKNIPCRFYDDEGAVLSYGRRCRGQKMQCTYPWYTWGNGARHESAGIFVSSCADKSDQARIILMSCFGNFPLIQFFCFDTKRSYQEKFYHNS